MKAKFAWGLVAAACLFTTTLWAAPTHRKGCEFPLEGVQVCWEATGEAGDAYAPFPEIHFLPVSRDIAGREEVLASYTRQIYRQLLPSGLAHRLKMEWDPVYYLEQAVDRGWPTNDWPTILWVTPRVLKNSSIASPGVVDWDVYLIDGRKGHSGRLIRRLRVRVQSDPKVRKDDVETAAIAAGLISVGASSAVMEGIEEAFGAVSIIGGAASLAQKAPPESGVSLELMTELAVRQMLFLLQYPVEELDPVVPKPKGLIAQVLKHTNTKPPSKLASEPPSASGTAHLPKEKGWVQRFFFW
ncbi:MAG: hypothetical protein HQL53_11950 [Magnetococcales bacterium]|nr:hypothetical protein [Magnetococcales bacterium]